MYLHRYAFLYYADGEEAANMVKNAGKFKINNQSLIIDFYEKMKPAWPKRKILNYVR
jgi:hypothetical protein